MGWAGWEVGHLDDVFPHPTITEHQPWEIM